MLGLAVRVDGRRPIGARARRIPEPELWLAVGPRQDKMAMKIVCWSLDDLQDYCQPHAPGQGTCDIYRWGWHSWPAKGWGQNLGDSAGHRGLA